MWPGFPGLGLLRRLRPHPGSSVDDAVARHRHGRPVGRASPGGFPRSLRFDRRDGCPTVPLRHRHEYAVDLPHGLPASRYKPAQESPELGAAGRTPHTSPHPPGWSWRYPRGALAVGSSRTPSVSLTGPEPSGSPDLSRLAVPPDFVTAAFRPPRRLPARAAASFTGPLRRSSGAGLAPPLETAAPRGARIADTSVCASDLVTAAGQPVRGAGGRMGGGWSDGRLPGCQAGTGRDGASGYRDAERGEPSGRRPCSQCPPRPADRRRLDRPSPTCAGQPDHRPRVVRAPEQAPASCRQSGVVQPAG